MLKTLRIVCSLFATISLLFVVLFGSSFATFMLFLFLSLTFVIIGTIELKEKRKKASYSSFILAGFILVVLVVRLFL